MLKAEDTIDPQAESFDDLDEEGDTGAPEDIEPELLNEISDQHPVGVPPERRSLHLPSSLETSPLRQAELTLRMKQVTRYLAAVREAVAEKSFQYSNVMRLRSTNAVRTRSRTVIIRVTERISHYARIYTRAREALVRLGADEITLKTFQVLTRDDVKASTAILDPNTPGASTIRLSWIWQTRLSGSAPETMKECE